MSDLDGTLSAITLEHLNAPGGPLRATITAESCTYFVRDTINVHRPGGSYSSTVWVKQRSTKWGFPKTAQQMKALSASMERMGWDQIAMGWHGLPSAGRIQR